MMNPEDYFCKKCGSEKSYDDIKRDWVCIVCELREIENDRENMQN